jgi:myosin protein heavy chain
VQAALDELRKAMDTKTSEDIKRREVERSREAEMDGLRMQIAQLHEAQEKQREASVALGNKLRSDVDGLRQRHAAAERDLASANQALKAKASEIARHEAAAGEFGKVRKAVEADLESTREKLRSTTAGLTVMTATAEDLKRRVQESEDKFADLEDALLPLEHERDAFRKRLEQTSKTLEQEIATRRKLQNRMDGAQQELADQRTEVQELQRCVTDADGQIKIRDEEISLLRSRQNLKIVEHVHVLESAKKMTDRQLVEQIDENRRMNQLLKSMETKINRLTDELEDVRRDNEQYRKKQSRARASLGPEDKSLQMNLADEKRARAAAEQRAAALERDVQDLRRNLSTAALSPKRVVSSSMDTKLMRAMAEIDRLAEENNYLADENEQLRQMAMTRSTNAPSSSRTDLLRGLQKSSEALGRDMSDQLRRLDAPLTSSRRENRPPTHGLNHSLNHSQGKHHLNSNPDLASCESLGTSADHRRAGNGNVLSLSTKGEVAPDAAGSVSR